MSNLTRRAALAGSRGVVRSDPAHDRNPGRQLAKASGLTGDQRLAEVARLLPIALYVNRKSTEAADLVEFISRVGASSAEEATRLPRHLVRRP